MAVSRGCLPATLFPTLLLSHFPRLAPTAGTPCTSEAGHQLRSALPGAQGRPKIPCCLRQESKRPWQGFSCLMPSRRLRKSEAGRPQQPMETPPQALRSPAVITAQSRCKRPARLPLVAGRAPLVLLAPLPGPSARLSKAAPPAKAPREEGGDEALREREKGPGVFVLQPPINHVQWFRPSSSPCPCTETRCGS